MDNFAWNCPKGARSFFLLIQTLPTFLGERIWIFRILIFLMFVGSQIPRFPGPQISRSQKSGLGRAWAPRCCTPSCCPMWPTPYLSRVFKNVLPRIICLLPDYPSATPTSFEFFLFIFAKAEQESFDVRKKEEALLRNIQGSRIKFWGSFENDWDPGNEIPSTSTQGSSYSSPWAYERGKRKIMKKYRKRKWWYSHTARGRLEVLVVDENVESGRYRKNWDRERGRRGLVFEEERSKSLGFYKVYRL